MKKPTIIIDGKEYKAKKPKVKMWRKLIKLQGSFNELESDSGLDELLEFISFCFDDITPEMLEENLDLDEFMPLFQEIGTWVGKMVAQKTGEIPNEQKEIVKN